MNRSKAGRDNPMVTLDGSATTTCNVSLPAEKPFNAGDYIVIGVVGVVGPVIIIIIAYLIYCFALP